MLSLLLPSCVMVLHCTSRQRERVGSDGKRRLVCRRHAKNIYWCISFISVLVVAQSHTPSRSSSCIPFFDRVDRYYPATDLQSEPSHRHQCSKIYLCSSSLQYNDASCHLVQLRHAQDDKDESAALVPYGHRISLGYRR